MTEELRRILEARARKAAEPPPRPDDEEHLEVLTFTLADERYGVGTAFVREVCPLTDLTSIPGTPSHLAGLMMLRGRVLAILDLRKLFELPSGGISELNRVLVLSDGRAEMGLLADSIVGITKLPLREIHEPPPTLTGVRERFLRGVSTGLTALFDGGRLLRDPDLKINEQTIR